MKPESAVVAGGLFNFAFAVFHLFFWKIFRWRQDLKKLLPVNRAVMQVLNLCLIFAFLVFTCVSVFYADEMIKSELGHALSGLIALFWLLRLIEQVVFFERNPLSWLFCAVFLIGAFFYGFAWAAA